MGRIRQAIVGYGGMGSWHAASVSEKVSDIEVYGAYDIRPEAMEAAKAKGLQQSFQAAQTCFTV